MTADMIDVGAFAARARSWLADNMPAADPTRVTSF